MDSIKYAIYDSISSEYSRNLHRLSALMKFKQMLETKDQVIAKKMGNQYDVINFSMWISIATTGYLSAGRHHKSASFPIALCKIGLVVIGGVLIGDYVKLKAANKKFGKELAYLQDKYAFVIDR